MTDYFQEKGIQPLNDNESPNHFLHLARLLRDFNIFDGLTSRGLAPPASESSINELIDLKIEQNGIQCPVCFKEHLEGEIVKQLPCKHLYHTDCILPWLTKTNSCPLCRFELPTDDEDYEAYRKEKIRSKERERDLEILHDSMFS